MLMLRVWHPETTETERAAIQFIFDCMADEALVGTNEQVFAYPALAEQRGKYYKKMLRKL